MSTEIAYLEFEPSKTIDSEPTGSNLRGYFRVPRGQFFYHWDPLAASEQLLGLLPGLDTDLGQVSSTGGHIRSERTRLPAAGRKVGLSFQSYQLCSNSDAEKFSAAVELSVRLVGYPGPRAPMNCSAVGLWDRRDHYPVQLSARAAARGLRGPPSAGTLRLCSRRTPFNLDSQRPTCAPRMLGPLTASQARRCAGNCTTASWLAGHRLIPLHAGAVVSDEIFAAFPRTPNHENSFSLAHGL